MHPILLNLWLSSVPLWVGLSLAFLLGIWYYWFQNRKNEKTGLIVFQSILRGLFLVGIILCFIPWKLTIEESTLLPNKTLLLVDDSKSMDQANFTSFIKQVEEDIELINPKDSELKLISLSKSSSASQIKPNGQNSSWAKVQDLIRKESKGYQVKDVFFITDGQLRDLETSLHRGVSMYLIPFGQIITQQKIGFSVPNKTLYSVVGEKIHVPISVWSNLKMGYRSPAIQVFVDSKLYQNIKATGGSWEEFQEVDLVLSNSTIGKHTIRIKVENDDSLDQSFTWIVQDYRAKVEAFALAPNPNLGVINRIAHEAKINLHWNFNSTISNLPKADNYVFYGILPKEIPQDKSVWYLNIPKELNKNLPPMEDYTKMGLYFPSSWQKHSAIRTSFSSAIVDLWKEQMAEVKNLGSYAVLDSTLLELFKMSFLRKADDLVSLDLDKSQITLGEELGFEIRQLNPEQNEGLKYPVQFKLSNGKSSVQFQRTLSQIHQVFPYSPDKPGKYQYQVKITYQGKEIDFSGEFNVIKVDGESVIGRNNANFQMLSHREGIKLIESSEIKKLTLGNKVLAGEVSLKEINLWEWPYFGLLMVVLISVEWIIRKRLNQI